MYLFKNITTWSQGLGNVSSATPLALLYTFSLGAKKSSSTLKLCFFLQNQHSLVLGSPVTSVMARSDASILSPLISE